MGVNTNELIAFIKLHENGLLPYPGAIADIGAQQIHMADQPTDSIKEFLKTFSPELNLSDEVLRELGNHGYVGDLLKHTKFEYCSFDLISTPYNRKFDLNQDAIDKGDIGRYDLVTNFGTTEHVMDQVRAFRTIHDLTKVGGLIFHVIPINIEHGLLSYTTKFADLLVDANDYEVVEINYNQAQTPTPIQGNVMGDSYFYRSGPPVRENSTFQVYSVSIIVQKTADSAFQLPLDLTENSPPATFTEVFGDAVSGVVAGATGRQSGASVDARRRSVGSASGRELLRELAFRFGTRLKL